MQLQRKKPDGIGLSSKGVDFRAPKNQENICGFRQTVKRVRIMQIISDIFRVCLHFLFCQNCGLPIESGYRNSNFDLCSVHLLNKNLRPVFFVVQVMRDISKQDRTHNKRIPRCTKMRICIHHK